jgi:F0F1-type ATP synthase membrane subunit a
LALIATLIPIILQLKQLWPIKFVHEYVPITWKWLIEGKWFGAKLWDIIISMFVGFLDIIWIFSKIISLSMRLFGNMSSGSILLNVLFIGLWGIFVSMINVNAIIWIPIILYMQWILVAVVQAFVFAMLVSIWIKLVIE